MPGLKKSISKKASTNTAPAPSSEASKASKPLRKRKVVQDDDPADEDPAEENPAEENPAEEGALGHELLGIASQTPPARRSVCILLFFFASWIC